MRPGSTAQLPADLSRTWSAARFQEYGSRALCIPFRGVGKDHALAILGGATAADRGFSRLHVLVCSGERALQGLPLLHLRPGEHTSSLMAHFAFEGWQLVIADVSPGSSEAIWRLWAESCRSSGQKMSKSIKINTKYN